MTCDMEWHRGNREVQRLRYVHVDGKMISGCRSCTDGMTHCMYPTTKLLRTMQDGKQFSISPAHVRDIKMRRSAPDLSGVWYDRKGRSGNEIRY